MAESLIKNNAVSGLGTSINIWDYRGTSNKYSAPSDGYIIAASGNTLGDRVQVHDMVGTTILLARCMQAGYSDTRALFVRKGFEFYHSTITDSAEVGTLYFYPFIN